MFTVEETANEFDFLFIADVRSINQVDTFVVKGADDKDRRLALVISARHLELRVFLADSAFGELEAGFVLVCLDEGGDGRKSFQEIVIGDFFRGTGVKDLEELVGGEGSNARGQVLSSPEMPDAACICQVAGVWCLRGKPPLVAGGTPVAEVLTVDGRAGELAGEDFLYDGEGIEPGKDEGSGLAVAQAAVELFADVVRESGDIADEGAGIHS